MRDLQNAYHKGGTVILLGEAGSGKTRIMYELLRRLEPTPRLIYAQGRSQESHLPFQPFIDSIRTSFTSIEMEHLEPIWKNTLSKLLPELFVGEETLNASVDLLAEKGAPSIYKAIHQLLLQATREQKVIFFLDDAQWCDDSSWEWFRICYSGDFSTTSGLLVIASRVEEENEHLREMIQDIPRGLRSFV